MSDSEVFTSKPNSSLPIIISAIIIAILIGQLLLIGSLKSEVSSLRTSITSISSKTSNISEDISLISDNAELIKNSASSISTAVTTMKNAEVFSIRLIQLTGGGTSWMVPVAAAAWSGR
jgi:hypothetical protein